MKWKTPSAEKKIDRIKSWHKWFAWHPVQRIVDGDHQWVWLETIYRKGVYFRDDLNHYEYRFNDFDLLLDIEDDKTRSTLVTWPPPPPCPLVWTNSQPTYQPQDTSRGYVVGSVVLGNNTVTTLVHEITSNSPAPPPRTL